MPHRGVTVLPEHIDVIVRRLETRIQRGEADACWPWTGAIDERWGYGRMRVGRHAMRVHRLVFMLRYAIKQLPRRLDVCHSCDNPACCNLAHLFLGDQITNMDDMVAKGRSRPGRFGVEHHNAKLTDDQVREIRSLSGSSKKLAPAYGISPAAFRYVRRREAWKHVV